MNVIAFHSGFDQKRPIMGRAGYTERAFIDEVRREIRVVSL